MENAKSIIDIEVNDDQFKAFNELFVKYKKMLGEMPSEWADTEKAVNKATDAIDKQNAVVEKAVVNRTDNEKELQDAIDKTVVKVKESNKAQTEGNADVLSGFREMTAALMAHNEMRDEAMRQERIQERARDESFRKDQQRRADEIKTEEKKQKALDLAESKEKKRREDRVKFVRSFTTDLGGMLSTTAGIGMNIAKWGVGAGLALLGGSIWGMNRFAGSASSDRMQAHGLGVSAGQLRSWNTNVGSYIDPSGILSAASNAYANPQQRALLQRVAASSGVAAGDIRSGNTNSIGTQALRGLIEFYNRNQGPNASQSWSARGFDQLISFSDIRRIATVPAAERERMFSNIQRDSVSMNNSDHRLAQWQDFYIQLHRTGQVLKGSFLDGLVGLTGPLKELSASMANFIRDFMGSDGFKEIISTVTSGFKALSDSMKDGSFNNAVHNLITGINAVAKVLGMFIPSNKPQAPVTPDSGDWKSGALMGGAAGAVAGTLTMGPLVGTAVGTVIGAGLGAFSGMMYDNPSVQHQYFSAIAQQESGGNPHAVSSKGALGMFQMMPATARGMGVRNPMDPQEEYQGAHRYVDSLRRMFDNDMLKTTAAYNAGPGGVRKAIAAAKANGGNWVSYLPHETQKYVQGVAEKFRAGNFNVNITNATGGAATVTAAMAGG